MGLQGLQEYAEEKCPDACEEVDMKELTEGRQPRQGPPVLLVDAMSCLKHLYGPSTDWVCGGQWSEMLRNVENFTRSFRQQNIQIVLYFDGEHESARLHEWTRTQNERRQLVRQILTHVMRMSSYPGKRLYVPPPVVSTCLRLAFLSCGVPVYCSIEDLHKEMAIYCNNENLAGVIAHHADFLLLKVPKYYSADHLKFSKKNITTVRFNHDKVFDALQLHHSRIGLFASLLGTPFIPEELLAPFYWNLLGPDHPLAKVKVKEKHQPMFPANDTIIKSVIDFLKNVADISNFAWIASQVFQSENVNLQEMTEALRKAVEHYSSTPKSTSTEQTDITLGRRQNEHRYQKMWQHWQQHQFTPQPVVPQHTLESVCEDSQGKAPTVTDLQQSFNNLQVTETQEVGVLSQLPLSPPLEEANIGGGVTGIVSSHLAASPPRPPPVSPSSILPTPPPSEESSPMGQTTVAGKEPPQIDHSEGQKADTKLTGAFPDIPQRVLEVTYHRHQSGNMMKLVYQVLTKGEISFGTTIEDEYCTDRPPCPLLFRPIRQKVYGILFNEASKKKQDMQAETVPPLIKEWCVYGGMALDKPDLVEPVRLNWDVPPVEKLWFNKGTAADNNRLKAFLSCMQCDTPNMTQTVMVPKRLVVLCCVLRYLLQAGHKGRSLLHPRELDAFLAQALSPHLTMECNASNLREIKLKRVDMRGIQLASIFMRGVETAVFANDACAVPIPWELVCPWNYFDGKLFQSKLLLAAENASLLELCDGKTSRVEKLQRMKWCITEGLLVEYSSSPGIPAAICMPRFPGQHGDGLLPTPPPFFGPVPPGLQGVAMHNAAFLPAGANISQMQPMMRSRGRGPNSKRPVSGLGGQLEVAGVPTARFQGNKAGRGYSDKDRIVVGGPMSVEMGRGSRRGRGGSLRGRRGGGGTGGARSVTWALDVDIEYDRSIGYVEQGAKPGKKSTNIRQIREGGDGGNEVPLVPRGRGDGANEMENLATDGIAGVHSGVPLQGNIIPQATPSQITVMSHTTSMQFNGQHFVPPTSGMQGLQGGLGLDEAPGRQVPVILAKPGEIPMVGRGRGVTMGMTGDIPPYGVQPGLIDAGSKGRGWWWEKATAQQQQPPPS